MIAPRSGAPSFQAPALRRRRRPAGGHLAPDSSSYTRGERVFHQKFGYGQVTAIEGNKLTVIFEKAGEKKVIDSFVDKA